MDMRGYKCSAFEGSWPTTLIGGSKRQGAALGRDWHQKVAQASCRNYVSLYQLTMGRRVKLSYYYRIRVNSYTTGT